MGAKEFVFSETIGDQSFPSMEKTIRFQEFANFYFQTYSVKGAKNDKTIQTKEN